jgi:two-component system nitrogen regulation response regulator NtrX
VISEDGYILTNFHVIQDSDRITVEIPEGGNGRVRQYEAEVVGQDRSTDLALIKVDADRRLPHLELGDSDRLRVGDWVMAIGNPIVYDRTVTVGVVSAKGRVLPDLSSDFSLDDYIQTDAAINFGNSGGPLVNIYGEVVGVNTAISVAGQGIGFAVPIGIAKGILDQLKADGRVARGYLGIELGQMDQKMAEGLGLPNAEGALVNNVAPDLPAEAAGIRPGDVIISIDDEKVESTNQLVRLISKHRPGDRVRIKVLRRGEERTFTAKLTDREEHVIAARFQEQQRAPSQEMLGISVGELTSEIRRNLDLDRSLEGVVVTNVNRTSEAWEEGIREGDVITEVNQEPIGGSSMPTRRDSFRSACGTTDPALRRTLAGPRCSRKGDGGKFGFPPSPFLCILGPEEKMKRRILVVDDEEAIRKSLQRILDYEGYESILAASAEEGLKAVEAERPDLILLDIKMPRMDGLELLAKLREKHSVPVIMISGHATVATAVEATKLGAFEFLEKPLERDRVLLILRNALEQSRLAEENRELRGRLERGYEMVGGSPAMKTLRQAIERAAPTNATVLVTGESGVGKELVAREIHRLSQRCDLAFIQVNCAAIPEDLIESELFGHEKGSFTGATARQTGKFVQADGGTIFLDEIGDMSPRTQAKVLRVLQNGEVEPVGAAKTLTVDVRVLAATNHDLESAITAGTFREDLFFRLNVIPIRCPPLRDRRQDIPALIDHFVQTIARDNNLAGRRLTEAAAQYLESLPWPGNIRELRNAVERLVIMAPGEVIDVGDIEGLLPSQPTVPAAIADESGSLQQVREVAERQFLIDKLEEFNWNIARTARAIGTPRSNLYKKMDQYRIRRGGAKSGTT